MTFARDADCSAGYSSKIQSMHTGVHLMPTCVPFFCLLYIMIQTKMGSGMITMSNICLSTALITLLEMKIGCHDDNIECETVYLYIRQSWVSNVPFIHASIDEYSSHSTNVSTHSKG